MPELDRPIDIQRTEPNQNVTTWRVWAQRLGGGVLPLTAATRDVVNVNFGFSAGDYRTRYIPDFEAIPVGQLAVTDGDVTYDVVDAAFSDERRRYMTLRCEYRIEDRD